MDKEFQTTSFIPKKPLAEERAPARSKPVGILMLVAILAFFASALFAAGAYLYRSYMMKRVDALAASLQRAEDEFERGLIEELQELDRRLGAASEILSNHVSLSPLFAILESLTLPSVRYVEFLSARADKTGEFVSVTLQGEASGYTDIALQSDILARNKNLRNIVFSNLQLDENGRVAFDLSFSVDRSLVLYGLQPAGGAARAISESVPPAGATTEEAAPAAETVPEGSALDDPAVPAL